MSGERSYDYQQQQNKIKAKIVIPLTGKTGENDNADMMGHISTT